MNKKNINTLKGNFLDEVVSEDRISLNRIMGDAIELQHSSQRKIADKNDRSTRKDIYEIAWGVGVKEENIEKAILMEKAKEERRKNVIYLAKKIIRRGAAVGALLGCIMTFSIPRVYDKLTNLLERKTPVTITKENRSPARVIIVYGAPDTNFYSEKEVKKSDEAVRFAYETLSSKIKNNVQLFLPNSKQEETIDEIKKSAGNTDELCIFLWNPSPRKLETTRGLSEKRQERNYLELENGDISASDIGDALTNGNYGKVTIIGNFENRYFKSRISKLKSDISKLENIGPKNTSVLGVKSIDKYGNSSLLNIAKRYAANPNRSVEGLVGDELIEENSISFNGSGLEKNIHQDPSYYSMPLFRAVSGD